MGIPEKLLAWYEGNGRHELPWRKTRDPYKVLVAELMLQQTQVQRVVPKYRAFIEAYPTIEALAKAPRVDVLRRWQGLGYNSRAVRLHTLARMVTKTFDGKLPSTEKALKELPGIGPYTAGAIIIFSQDQAATSVDVNVARVLRRLLYSMDQRPSDTEIKGRALQLMHRSGRPHDWHSALMDFGSATCTARQPRCSSCPLHHECRSRGIRPDEPVKKREKFHGSVRWWRGRVLTLLLERPRTRQQVEDELGKSEHLEKAIASMVKEGVVRERSGRLRV